MKQFFEFIPLIIFFLVFKMVNIYAATAALMVSMGLMFAVNYFKHGKVEKMHIITLVMVLIFGALTLILRDDAFIKWKVTVVYALFSAVLLISQFIYKKPVIKQMLAKELKLPDSIWKNLNLAWAVFFALLAIINVYVAFNMSQEMWVNFKVFGLLIATLVFTILSGLYVYKYLPESNEKQILDKNKPEE